MAASGLGEKVKSAIMRKSLENLGDDEYSGFWHVCAITTVTNIACLKTITKNGTLDA